MDTAEVPGRLKLLMAAWALAVPAVALPTPATAQASDSMSIEVRVRGVRTLTTPPVVSNRSSQMMRQGIPLPQIVAGLQAMEPYREMRYIGIERFDPRTGIYTLRFLNGRQIVVVQVDGRSGRVINRGF